MSHVPHELADEFPQHAEKLAARTAFDKRFAHLAQRYHRLSRDVRRAENLLDPVKKPHLDGAVQAAGAVQGRQSCAADGLTDLSPAGPRCAT